MAVAHEASSAVRLEPAASETAERLFQQHSGWIYGYCLRLLRSPEEAEDALQATYLNACRTLKDGFEPRSDSAWLLRVAHNVCLSRLRSSGRRTRVERLHGTDVLEETAAAPEGSPDELIGLPEALARLPEQQRRAILLREWQGLSYREVADELNLTQSAVETLIFRARRSLAAALENPETSRRRAICGVDLGVFAAAFKSVLGGGATAKLALATAAAVTTATVVVADPVGWHDPSAAAPATTQVRDTRPVREARPDPAPARTAAVADRRADHDAAEHRLLAATGSSVAPGGAAEGKERAGTTPEKAHREARRRRPHEGPKAGTSERKPQRREAARRAKTPAGRVAQGGAHAHGSVSAGRRSSPASGAPAAHAAAPAKGKTKP